MQISVDLGTFAESVTLHNLDKYGLLVSGTRFSKWLLDSHNKPGQKLPEEPSSSSQSTLAMA